MCRDVTWPRVEDSGQNKATCLCTSEPCFVDQEAHGRRLEGGLWVTR